MATGFPSQHFELAVRCSICAFRFERLNNWLSSERASASFGGQLVTFTVIAIINTFNILVTLCIWKFIARPIMGDGSNTSMVFVGGAVMGALSGILSFTIDCVMDGVPAFDFQGLMVKLIEDENWRTETEDEDANIMKTFFFKVCSVSSRATLLEQEQNP
mmetsp:Transcript_4567/g.13817  ORF Transcript_4567/g.13817 Transcript_4567/m.13817 type:complete len:160 (+) Transcript_4567:1070-1549(+)